MKKKSRRKSRKKKGSYSGKPVLLSTKQLQKYKVNKRSFPVPILNKKELKDFLELLKQIHKENAEKTSLAKLKKELENTKYKLKFFRKLNPTAKKLCNNKETIKDCKIFCQQSKRILGHEVKYLQAEITRKKARGRACKRSRKKSVRRARKKSRK